MPPSLDASAVRAWCRLSLRALGRAREAIDAINVYPVADGDTGTNLFLTVESAAQSVEAVFEAHASGGALPSLAEAFRALSHGALIGACGNSGTILAQLLRGMNEALTSADTETPADSGPGGGDRDGTADALRRALRLAAESAYEAVARPVEGTMLTVATRAAEAAQAAAGGPAEVVRAAHAGAVAALGGTPGQLEPLRRAGVVDAGGLGLVAVLGALCEAVTGEAPPGPAPATTAASAAAGGSGPAGGSRRTTGARTARALGTSLRAGPPARLPHPSPAPAGDVPAPQAVGDSVSVPPGAAPADATAEPRAAHGSVPAGPPPAGGELCPADAHVAGGGPGFEVVYLLEADAAAVGVLRARLDALGDSLVVVGGDGLWNVHVHVDDAGAAIEAGIEAGRPYRIKVTHFGEQAAGPHPGERAARAVVAVVHGEGMAELCVRAGATVVTVRPGEPPASGEIAAAIRRAHAREVVLLPNDGELRHTAGAAAEQARADGVRVALIPTRSPVQGLAALAVHEPSRRFDEDVVAMTSAAGATRYAELAVAERESWTMAGVCQAGDVLGMIDGDVAVIGTGLAETAVTVLDRMLAAGGELVTLVLGAAAPPDLADRVEAHVHDRHLAVDTVRYEGGHHTCPLLIGVE